MIHHHTAEGLTPYGEPDNIGYYTTEYFESSKDIRISAKNESAEYKNYDKIFEAIRKLNKIDSPATMKKIRELSGLQLSPVNKILVDLMGQDKVERIQLSRDEALSRGWAYNQTEIFKLKGDWEWMG